jgi:hypothetical protein
MSKRKAGYLERIYYYIIIYTMSKLEAKNDLE